MFILIYPFFLFASYLRMFCRQKSVSLECCIICYFCPTWLLVVVLVDAKM